VGRIEKLLILGLLLSLASKISGQENGTIVIKVVNEMTGETIPFANLYFLTSNIHESTDSLGSVRLDRNAIDRPDTIIVSFIGFEVKRIPISIPVKDDLTLSLTPLGKQLSPVVIQDKSSLTVKKILKSIIANTEKNYPTSPTSYHFLYRQTIQEHGTFTELNEGVFESYNSPYPQPNKDSKIWQDWHYDQSLYYTSEYRQFTFSNLLKEHNTTTDAVKLLAYRTSDNQSPYGLRGDIYHHPLDLLALDKVKYQFDFLDPDLYSKYEFKLLENEIIQGENCFVIQFSPKATKREFLVVQSRKMNSAIYAGIMHVSIETRAVLSFHYQLVKERSYDFFQGHMPLLFEVQFEYKKQGNHYVIDHILQKEINKLYSGKSSIPILYERNIELFVKNTISDNPKPIQPTERFKYTRFTNLRNYPEGYQPEYWDSIPNEFPFLLEKKLVDDLSKKLPLAQQFINRKPGVKLDLTPPRLAVIDTVKYYHEEPYSDHRHWVSSEKHDNDLRLHLQDENDYARNEFVPDIPYQNKIFNRLIKISNEVYKDSETEAKYFISADSLGSSWLYKRLENNDSLVLLNLRDLPNYTLKNLYELSISPNENNLLLTYWNDNLFDKYCYVVSLLEKTIVDSLKQVESALWLNDSIIIFTELNSKAQPHKLFLKNIFNHTTTLLHHELDPTFGLVLEKQNDELFCIVESKNENEIHHLIPKGDSVVLRKIVDRKPNIQHLLQYRNGRYYLLTTTPIHQELWTSEATEVIQFNLLSNIKRKDYITDFTIVGDHIVAVVYKKSIPQLMHFSLKKKKWEPIKLELGLGQYEFVQNYDFSGILNFVFSAPQALPTQYSFDIHQQKITSVTPLIKYREFEYCRISTRRIWVRNGWRTKIPVTVASSNSGIYATRNVILKGYGAYGANMTPGFSLEDFILLQEGYTIVYAHVRGESILGQRWYNDGKLYNKKNSMDDYIAVAKKVRKKYLPEKSKLIGYGQSAGGLLVAQAMNQGPELFDKIILDHPFVDVLNTMMDSTLALTADEYKEWGNPQEKRAFDYMQSYSPYEQIKSQAYPSTIVFGGYYDHQCPIWQVVKYVDKLRAHQAGAAPILLITDMNGGHTATSRRQAAQIAAAAK
jgi:oligopeptidase B